MPVLPPLPRPLHPGLVLLSLVATACQPGSGADSDADPPIEATTTTGSTTTTATGVDIVEYEGDPASTAPTQLRMLFALVNTTGTIPETSEPTALGTQEYYTATELGDAFFLDPDGVAAFLDEASYGQLALSGTVVGWFHEGDLGLDASDMFDARDDYFDLACAEVDCATYDVFVLVGRAETGGQQTGWQMQNTVTTSQGEFTDVGILFMINSPFLTPVGTPQAASLILPSKYYAHELTHTLGSTGHANSLWCDGGTLGGTCEQRAYGSVFSLMGSGAFATHPHLSTKRALGWIDASQVHEVDAGPTFAGGEYTIHPMNADGGLEKGITVSLANPVEAADLVLDQLHIEVRSATGFDRWLTRLDGPSAPDGGDFLAQYTPLVDIDREGVLVTLDASGDGVESVWTLDAHPDTAFVEDRGIYTEGNPGKFADAILNLGETLDLPELDVIITPTAIDPDGAVTVSLTPR